MYFLFCTLKYGEKKDGSEKMERDGDRQEKIEGLCSTGHSPQWAVAPMEEKIVCFEARILFTFLT
jgi:hypothetical protein